MEFVTWTGRTKTSPGTNFSKLNAVNGVSFNATDAVMKLLPLTTRVSVKNAVVLWFTVIPAMSRAKAVKSSHVVFSAKTLPLGCCCCQVMLSIVAPKKYCGANTATPGDTPLLGASVAVG